jgi:hypothetical protein
MAVDVSLSVILIELMLFSVEEALSFVLRRCQDCLLFVSI